MQRPQAFPHKRADSSPMRRFWGGIECQEPLGCHPHLGIISAGSGLSWRCSSPTLQCRAQDAVGWQAWAPSSCRERREAGRWWSSDLRCEAGGACVPEHVLEDAVTLVLRTGLKGHLSSHELPAVCPMLCSQASASCCLSVIPPEDQTCHFSGLCAAQRWWGEVGHGGAGGQEQHLRPEVPSTLTAASFPAFWERGRMRARDCLSHMAWGAGMANVLVGSQKHSWVPPSLCLQEQWKNWGKSHPFPSEITVSSPFHCSELDPGHINHIVHDRHNSEALLVANLGTRKIKGVLLTPLARYRLSLYCEKPNTNLFLMAGKLILSFGFKGLWKRLQAVGDFRKRRCSLPSYW